MLTDDQVAKIKSQLLSQIKNSPVSKEKKKEVGDEIFNMSNEQVEEFVEKNNLADQSSQECIFCSIIDDKIPSYKIAEDKTALAVLEINPVSVGHIIVIPKIHSEEIPRESFALAESISKHLSKILEPKKIDLVESSLFNHKIINIIPVYKNENIHSQRKKARDSELGSLQKKILPKKEEPHEEKPKKESSEPLTEKNYWLPKRIP